jgi:hypothetical protein
LLQKSAFKWKMLLKSRDERTFEHYFLVSKLFSVFKVIIWSFYVRAVNFLTYFLILAINLPAVDTRDFNQNCLYGVNVKPKTLQNNIIK